MTLKFVTGKKFLSYSIVILAFNITLVSNQVRFSITVYDVMLSWEELSKQIRSKNRIYNEQVR